MKILLLALTLTIAAFGQAHKVKGPKGETVAEISDMKLFRHSDYFNDDVPAFEASVKNVSGRDVRSIPITATVHRKDGSTAEFSFTAVGICEGCDFLMDSTAKVTHGFLKPWPFTPKDFDFVDFAVPKSWNASDSFAEDRRKLERFCATTYVNTIDKKSSDLTVREQESIKNCRELGLYRK